MELSEGVHRVLEPLVAASHRVVRGLEEGEVPARLRAIRAKSARRLPPPLARALLAALDEIEWLRTKVLEEGKGLDRLGKLFLERPEGWDREITDAVSASRVAELEALLGQAERDRDAARLKVELLKEKVKSRSERAKGLEAALRDERDRRTEAVRAAEARVGLGFEDEVRRLRDQLGAGAALADELGRLRRRMTWLVAQRDKQATPATSSPPGLGPWSGDPLEKARLLDEIAAAAASTAPGRDRETAPRMVEQFALRPGIRPDAPGAIEQVLKSPRVLTVALDGYNVAAEFGLSLDRLVEARQYVLDVIVRLEQRAQGRHTILAVFDGEGGRQRKGNAVFVPFADDELRRLAGEIPGLVVISNDREVIEDTSRLGAVALWTTALVRWAEGR